MKVKANLKMGNVTYQFEVEEKGEKETLNKIIVLTNPRRMCNECQNKEGFYFTSNKDREGNIYINVKCPKCGAKSKLGEYKTSGYFWRDFEKYTPTAPKKQDVKLEDFVK